ncbi:unnamed protein product [Prunus armeniaca]
MANYLCRHIGQVAGEIIVGHLCTKKRYTQISKGSGELENWPTTCGVKSGRWLGKSWSDNYSQIGQVAGEIFAGQLCTENNYMQISKANWERGNWPTTCAFKSGKWLGKSLLGTCVVSIGTSRYRKATGNWEIGQPPVQSNRAGGWGNVGRTIVK